MKQSLSLARKELESYFGSPMAIIFVGAFLAVTLFSFFWVDTFFVRGIADVRPLFRWMPLLMIFLVSALTMRQWSEEERSGTLEVLLTLPVSRLRLVLGKFLAVMALVALALALTLFLPITVALLGNLDWGPVIGGYLAALLLAAAYAAIGLFVSSRTDNQIVALILSVLVCGLFYVAGSGGVTDFFGDKVDEILRAIGSGSRFESVQRGVIDLRDLLYYLSLTAIFLTLNVLSLDRKGWSLGDRTASYRRAVTLATVLMVANLVMMNVWLYPLRGLRLDLTQQREYTLSATTRELLSDLREPLLIRGYFSEKTHPLLAPLVPRIRDLLDEYRVASGGRVQVDIIDPATDAEKEAEANQVYGIQPMPFQVDGRYETSIINSYFDVLIRYGDQNVVLGFRNLIEIEARRDGSLDVRLRNLEYDLTSSIKKAVYGFQSVDAVLAALATPAQLTAYITPNTLPESMKEAPATIDKVLRDIIAGAKGKLSYTVVDPDAANSPLGRNDLYERFGLQPLAVSLFSPDSYYLHMVLQIGDEAQIIYPSGTLSEAEVRTSIESALKRGSSGFLQVVGLWTPSSEPTQDIYGRTQQPLSSWQQVSETLGQEYEVRPVDLTQGQVASDVDVLLVIAPQNMTDKDRFAVDQYLMRGGSVIVAAGRYGVRADQFTGSLALQPLEEGLHDMLASYGLTVERSLVMDPQNEPFAVPVTRQVGNMQVQEIQAIAYPFFVDVRTDGMATDNPVVSNIPAVTMNWVSPITVDEAKNADRQVTLLLQSGAGSWTQADTNIQPNFDLYEDLGFPVGGDRRAHTLAVSTQGVFESAFKGKPPPFEQDAATETGAVVPPLLETSPDTARLIVMGSSEFLDDLVFSISARMARERYLNSLKLVQNAVAWSTEDLDLLTIRSRGAFTRVLHPMSQREQSFWEGSNYLAALAALIVIALLGNYRRKNEQPMELITPAGTAVSGEQV